MNNNLSTLSFKEMKLGLKKSFEIEITDSLVNSFAELSGDFNPLHTNKDYAISNGFENKICHGMLLGSFFSQLIGMYLPGKHALYLSQSVEFRNPCFIGDTVKVFSKVIDKSKSTKILKTESKITNPQNEILLTGVGRVIVRDD